MKILDMKIRAMPEMPEGQLMIVGPPPESSYLSEEEFLRAWAKRCAVITNLSTDGDLLKRKGE